MEVPRQCLAAAGKFPGAGYTDVRCSAPPGGTELDANLGRLPILEGACAPLRAGEDNPRGPLSPSHHPLPRPTPSPQTVDGVSIGQSTAINYWVAQHCNLLGSSPAEAASILSFGEHLRELREKYAAMVPWGTEPSAETLNTFFDSAEATDSTGPADGSKRGARNLLWFMGRLEHLVGDGFAVGGKLSLADIQLFNIFADSLTAEQSLGDLPSYRREPFGSLARTSAALAKHPKLAKIVAAVGAHPNIQKWLQTRGQQGF